MFFPREKQVDGEQLVYPREGTAIARMVHAALVSAAYSERRVSCQAPRQLEEIPLDTDFRPEGPSGTTASE